MTIMSETASSKLGLKFRQATFDDYDEIALLATRYRLEPETREDWVHLWANNPVYHQLPNWPIGWVFENEDKRIVGYIGNVPLLYEMGGQRLTVAASRGFVVDIPYRSYSLSLLNQFFKQKAVETSELLQQELSEISHEHKSVATKVITDLLCLRYAFNIRIKCLRLDNTTRRNLLCPIPMTAELFSGE